MTLMKEYEQLKLGIKYKLKEMLISRILSSSFTAASALPWSLNSLFVADMLNLADCVEAGISYWKNELSKYIESAKDEQVKLEREMQVNDFVYYLMIDVLYDLLIKKKDFSDIKNPWMPKGILMECVVDSGICPIFPVRTHMQIYKDKVILNGMIYYNPTLSSEENEENKGAAVNYVKTKSYEAIVNFMSNCSL